MQDKLAISQRFGERLFQVKLLNVLQVERLVEEPVLPAACLLGRVHGCISAAKQILNGLAISGANCDAYTGAAVQFRAIELISRGQMPCYPIGPLLNVTLGAIARQQDDELIAAKDCKDVISDQMLTPVFVCAQNNYFYIDRFDFGQRRS